MSNITTECFNNFSLQKSSDRNGGLFYDSNCTIISHHIYNLYFTPLLTQDNKTSESERKREQLQLQKSAAYEICKSRGRKSSVIVDSITRICGLRQHQLSQKCCNVIKLSQTTLDAVLGPSPKLSPQPTSATTTREINVVRNKCLHPKEGIKGKPGTNVNDNGKKIFSIDRIIEQQELESSALSQAIRYEMRTGKPPSLEDLEKFLSDEEISIIWDDLQYLYPGFDKTTTTTPDRELIEVVI